MVFTRRGKGKVFNGVINTSSLLRKTKQTQRVRALVAVPDDLSPGPVTYMMARVHQPPHRPLTSIYKPYTHPHLPHTYIHNKGKRCKLNILIKVNSYILF